MARAAKKTASQDTGSSSNDDLHALFEDTLKDIYFAEKQIYKSLPKMAKAAQSDEVRDAFLTHRGQTEGQIARLEQVFEIIGKKARGKTCDAIMGILEEGKEIMEEYEDSPALDAGLVAAGQAVEHYEISRYGTLRTWAKRLGLDDAADLLQETLDEEKETDELLSGIAERTANPEAEKGGEEDEDEEPAQRGNRKTASRSALSKVASTVGRAISGKSASSKGGSTGRGKASR